ncbi:5-formyltetrahydrofolate cyclo-ligase [Marinomonas posidonica]|uniref:5-formyltetrahydrofolate cyclo-ligase n=1 Tax=Marinomonas posidonica (strain CECT 7376 / NCIMB 14433 / IVIA-Po-181) TaxID=491952 RepID=F6CYR7_MARPP|nr:5-formyltetrahydrofolate cyclo-ligase [Marinomonas posidonica]AEF55749.1 5-formyltetrahydrofolate cyclo-ligase [Marinomonas posidonica IVIA-Po-181]
MTHPQLDRQSLRKTLRHARRQLSEQEQQQAAEQLLEQTLHSQWLENVDHVALYLANDGEISPHLISQYCWQHKIKTYLPVVKGETLRFALYDHTTQWHNNQFGIAEPITEKHHAQGSLDIVFMPLVGFDQYGGRLGMGGGFYDKSFANKGVKQNPLLIGLAHDCQQVEQLPIEPWDVPLQAILSPSQIIQF